MKENIGKLDFIIQNSKFKTPMKDTVKRMKR